MGAPSGSGPVVIHGHCLRLYPVRPAYRPALDVDGVQSGAGHSSVVLNSPVK